jgi:hypothetical protein
MNGPISVHIDELVLTGVPLIHQERLGPAVEAALTRRLAAGADAPPPRRTPTLTPETLADTIAASVHDAIQAAGGAP